MAERLDRADTPDGADTGAEGAFTARAAATRLGVNERTVRRAIARGDLPAVKHAGAFRIASETLDRYAAQLAGSAPPGLGRSPPPAIGSARLALLPPTLPAPLTPLVGRDREVATVTAMLRQDPVRLLTLTGPGGVGKTRLALQVASEIHDSFPDGTWFVPLSAVADPELVLPALARAVGVPVAGGRPLPERLASILRGRVALLVLDNFEQVLAAGRAVAELLAACPGLKVLATSRARLHISGEHAFPVPPLALADPEHLPPRPELGEVEAIRLFASRARAVDPGFALTEANAAALAEICRRLDGLPLAIELAAARAAILSPGAMLARMERRLPLLTEGPRDAPDRLRTMHGAIAWSYDLLPPVERRLFRRLAVFVGGFDLAAAEAVAVAAGDPDCDPIRGIATLADQSLLRRESGPDDEPRFVMLETVREFAAERLAASDDEALVRDAHRDHFLALVEEAEQGLLGPGQVAWQRRLDADHPNLRAALHWATGRAPAVALRLATALWRFWWSHPAEGCEWLERALADAPDAPSPLRAKALGAASILASFRGDAERGAVMALEAIALAEGNGDAAGRVYGLLMLSFAERCRGDHAASAACAEAAAAAARGLGDDAWSVLLTALTLNRVGHEAYERGDWPRAEAALEEALGRWRQIGYPWGIGIALAKLADVARTRGDEPRAAALYGECLDYWQVLRHELAGVEVLSGLARLAAPHHPDQAVRLSATVAAFQARVGLVAARALRDQTGATLAAAREVLGDEKYEAAWAAGISLSVDMAVEEARAAADLIRSSPPHGERRVTPAPARLTPREVEVLGLLAHGHTDREIADALYLSPRTVHHHVATVLSKLGARSRTAAVAAAQAAGLLPHTSAA